MHSKIKVLPEIWALVNDIPRRAIQQTAEGKNPNVKFSFREVRLPVKFLLPEMRLPRGYKDHVPYTDEFELRNSTTVEFLGTPWGTLLAHLFNDGTIKTSEEMWAEKNERLSSQRRLAAEESKFPRLGQTPIREQAYAQMLATIRTLRNDTSRSLISKQVEKNNAEMQYNDVLRAQEDERAAAARAASTAQK